MPRLALFLLLGALNLCARAQSEFVNLHWPYDLQVDYLEGLLYESTALSSLAADCVTRNDSTVSAQWIRIGYHDMSTHNIADRTGGLDASIRFELDRPENVGVGMRKSLEDFIALLTPFASMADLIAMGVTLGYPSCGNGPFAPYRAGRIDASAAGPSGVPEPQQDLQTHIAKFAAQGFNQEEMIGLVACGHALGGVRKQDFDVTGNQTFGLFHGSQTYDISVVTGYLDDTTPNPLVAGTNDTLKSDLRIFSSDGNVTMKGLADKAAFDQTCTNLIERMINTVPSNVRLTDPIQPIQNKIGKTRLFVSSDADNQLVLTTSLRVLNQKTNANRNITLFYSFKQSGETFSVASSGHGPLGSRGGNGFSLKGIPAEFWGFSVPNINSTTSISKFWFEIDENDGSDKVIIDNGGDGFVIEQDEVLFDVQRSQRISLPDAPTSGEESLSIKVVVGVRSDKQPSLVKLYVDWFDSFHLDFVSTTGEVNLSEDSSIPSESGYIFYSGTIDKASVATSFNVHAEFSGGDNIEIKYVDSLREIQG